MISDSKPNKIFGVKKIYFTTQGGGKISYKNAWVVRAGDDNELFDIFEKESLVAVGWEDMGDVRKLTTREEVKQRYRETHSEQKKSRVATGAGQIYRFAHEIQKGDMVLTYNKSTREYLIGEITSDYKPNPNPDFTERGHYQHVREVDWKDKVSRDEFTVQAKNSLGAALTVFQVNEHIEEIENVLTGKPTPDKGDETQPLLEDVEAKASELISDKISNMDPYDFQDLVAAVLRTMGLPNAS